MSQTVLPKVFVNGSGNAVFNSSDEYNLPYCHIHNHNELLLLVSGRIRLENTMETFEVNAPAAIIHKSYTLHRAILLDGIYQRYVISFHDDTIDISDSLKDIVGFFKQSNMTVIKLSNEMAQVMFKYADRYLTLDENDGSRNIMTYIMLYELSKFKSSENTASIKIDIVYINDVIQYIASHYSEPLTINNIAACFYISRSKLISDFTKSTNMTIKQYITLVRMNVARSMIAGGATIKETAHASGFSSTGNFIYSYRKFYNINPAT